jgi:hypothetical protein
MRIRHACLVLLALGFIGGGLLGCEDDAEAITTPTTCNDVCERYQSCYDEDLDVDECAADCENETFDLDEPQERLDDCDECLETSSCTEAFRCTDDCVGLLDVGLLDVRN